MAFVPPVTTIRRAVCIAAGLLSVPVFSGCDLLGPDSSAVIPAISFRVAGGFIGGTHTILDVDPEGKVTLASTYPELELQLSEEEHGNILTLFDGFREIPSEWPPQCIDDFICTIEREGADYSHAISIDMCTLASTKDSNPFVSRLDRIVRAMTELAARVREESAQWLGLTAEFSHDRQVYGVDEPVLLRYVISNPTSKSRSIHFRHGSQFWFGLEKVNFPPFHYFYPESDASDSTEPSVLEFAPGETKILTYSWDQRISYHGGDSALGIGTYKLHMNLFAGELPYYESWFEVVDRNVPVGGFIVPDLNGEGSESPSYSFNLYVHNWTSTSVDLHFESSQFITVELFDLDLPTPGPLLFSSPVPEDSTPSTVTLAPGEGKSFTYTASKSSFGEWYMWTYARIRLRSTNIDFARDGQLRIINYRP